METKIATLKTRLDQAIDHIDKMTRALTGAGAAPESLHGASDNTPSDAEFPTVAVDDAAAQIANASACTRVWIATAGLCGGRKGTGSLHGFARPDPATPGPEITPYCPSCNQPFVLGGRPMDPNVDYVVPKEARRMTGS